MFLSQRRLCKPAHPGQGSNSLIMQYLKYEVNILIYYGISFCLLILSRNIYDSLKEISMLSRFYISLFSLLMICSVTLHGQGNSDGLTKYVERLKASKASGGSETAFMSVGSDFLYAQEYFEANNYASAAYDFARIVRQDPSHAYANYQLAIALLRQQDAEKAKEAQPFLEQAFRLDSSLQERYARDVPQAALTAANTPG